MSFIQNLFTSRDNNADGGTNVGQEGRLWYDPVTNGIYVSDGNTAGGFAVGGLGNGVPGGLNTQVQFNSNGQFGGSAGFVFDRSSNTITGGGPATFAGTVTGANILTVGQVSATGNITGNVIFGNGSQLTNIPTILSGELVGNITANGYFINGLTAITVEGDITGDNLLTAGNITGGNLIVNTDVSATGSVVSNILFADEYVSTTGNVVGGNVLTAGTVSATANITGGNVTTAGTISATGNVTGGNILTTGVVSTSGNVAGSNVNASTDVSATGNVKGGNLQTSGNLSVSGNISCSGASLSLAGTVTAGDIYCLTNLFVPFNGTAFYGNAQATDQISTSKTAGGILIGATNQTGTITLGLANVSQTVGIATGVTSSGNTKTINIGTGGAANTTTTISIGTNAGNATVTYTANTTVAIANTSGTALSVAGNITGANIITVGTASATGNITGGNIVTVGNVAGNFFIGNGSALTGITASLSGNLVGNIFGNGFGANAFSFVSATGNITGGNILSAGLANITGNITGGNLSVTGNANIAGWSYVPQLWFRGALSGDQALTALTDTTILYNTNVDPGNWGATASSNGQIKPTKAGWYEVISRAQFSPVAGNVNAQINHQILVNGIQLAIAQVPNNSVVGAGVSVMATTMVQLNGSTDYITTSCYSTITGQTCVGINSTLITVKWISTA